MRNKAEMRQFKGNQLLFIFLFIYLFVFISSNPAFSDVKKSNFDWFWMIYEKDRNMIYSTSVYRPFFMRNIYSSGRVFEGSLMPVLYWKYVNKDRSDTKWKSLVGLIGSVDHIHPNGVRDYDFGFFPLIFYGDSVEQQDRYFFMMPFGGTIKGKLVQDKISAYAFPGVALFFLFPPSNMWVAIGYFVLSLIPVYAEYTDRDYTAKAILWPLFTWGKSSNRDDLRLLPFYAHKYKKNMYNNYSILLIGNFRNIYTSDDVQRTRFIFPFFGRRWNDSSKMNSSTLFWPFFSWGYNKKMGDLELNFPWPLVMIQDQAEPKLYKRIFFPFYGEYIFQKNRTFFVTPLYFRIQRNTKAYSSDYHISAIIVWYFKRDYHKKPHPYYGNKWRFLKIWPLFHYEKDDRGNVSFNILSIYPFRDPDGYELMYQPFWTLFEYKKTQTGEKRIGILLRTYYQVWADNYLYIKVPLLFCLKKEDGRLTKLSVLFSMFGYSRNESRSRIRLFWIPITIRRFDQNGENKVARSHNMKLLFDEYSNDNELYEIMLRDLYARKKFLSEPYFHNYMQHTL